MQRLTPEECLDKAETLLLAIPDFTPETAKSRALAAMAWINLAGARRDEMDEEKEGKPIGAGFGTAGSETCV